MTVHLDHLMVPSQNKMASAKLLAGLLGVPWSETGTGPFLPVYVNDGLTLDFDEWTDPIPMIHYCFRVNQDDFDAIEEARIREAAEAEAKRIAERHGMDWKMLSVEIRDDYRAFRMSAAEGAKSRHDEREVAIMAEAAE